MGPNSHFLWAFHPCFCLPVNGRERRALWDNCAIPSEEPSGLVVYIVMLPFRTALESRPHRSLFAVFGTVVEIGLRGQADREALFKGMQVSGSEIARFRRVEF